VDKRREEITSLFFLQKNGNVDLKISKLKA